ncbi:hypothetical protein HYU17_02115 [Candidatus Woesearchaeota archaeon]|nr:hypothetical protein [Candidatus Woesearchaeota archaeon]
MGKEVKFGEKFLLWQPPRDHNIGNSRSVSMEGGLQAVVELSSIMDTGKLQGLANAHYEVESTPGFKVLEFQRDGTPCGILYIPPQLEEDIAALVHEGAFPDNLLRCFDITAAILNEEGSFEGRGLVAGQDKPAVPLFLAMESPFGRFYSPGRVSVHRSTGKISGIIYNGGWRMADYAAPYYSLGGAAPAMIVPHGILPQVTLSFDKVPMEQALREQGRF